MTAPALFIGLGGTGKQTLMHLRRLILDNYGAGVVPKTVLDRYGSGRLPHTAFLCFDSDPRLLDLDGQRFDEILAGAALSGAEFQSIEIDPEHMKTFYEHPERYPSYTAWYDFSLRKYGIPRNGCGQTRPWGRYAFFNHYDKIRSSIRAALDSLVDARTVADAREMGVTLETGSVNVFLVFSIAGGTGSGTFIDTAFLLRDLESEIGRSLPTQSLILMPGAFSSNPEAKIYANAYAALLELEHYNLSREDRPGAVGGRGFPVYWPGAYNPDNLPRRILPPAFEATWLIGERSRGPTGTGGSSVDPSRKSELTGMMAEWLFLRTSPLHSAIGGQISSDAGNYTVTEMAETAALPIMEAGSSQPTGRLELSRRYGSFGLSKIYLPKSVLHQIAAHRLVGDVLRDWSAEPILPTGTAETIEREIWPKVLLRQGSGGRDGDGAYSLFTALSRKDASASVVDDALAGFNEAFDPDAVADEALDDLGAVLTERFRDFMRRRISDDEADASKQGDLARLIQANAAAAERQIRDGLDDALADALRTTGRRFSFAGEMLVKLATDFRNAAADAGRLAADRAQQASEARRDVEELLLHARGERSAFVLSKIAKVAIDFQQDVIEFELERQMYLRAKGLADYASRLIGQTDDKAEAGARASGLIHQLAELRRDLVALGARVQQRIADLQVRSTSTLNQRVIAQNTEAYYLSREDEPMNAERVRAAEMRLLADHGVFSGGVGSPWTLRKSFSGAGAEQLLGQFVEFGRREMEHVPQRANNALQMFDSQHPTATAGVAGYVSALRPLISNASAWLAITSTGSADWGRSSAIAQTFRVAYRPTGGPEDRRLVDTLVGPNAMFPGLNAREPALLSMGDAVYFEQEIAGFPLSVVPNIKDYRDRAYIPYLTEQRKGGDREETTSSALHIEPDGAKFGTLIQPTQEEATARAAALELLVEAVAKWKLAPDRDTDGMTVFSRRTMVGFTPVAQEIGRYDRSVLMLLATQSRAVIELQDQIREVEAQWATRPDGGAEVKARMLALLDYYRFDEARQPITLPEWKTAVTRVIERLTARFGPELSARAAKERPALEQWSVEEPVGSGFRRILDL